MNSANRDLRRRVLLVFLGAWLGSMGLPAPTHAATSASTNTPPGTAKRFLLVMETSRAMAGRKSLAVQTVYELLTSSIRGQARPGDSLGVWTFDEELQAGRFPLQNWTASNAADIASKVVEFLRGQNSDKAADMKTIMQPVEQLVRRSDCLTAILITSGEPVSEIRFSEEINQLTSRWNDHQRKKNLPFVTVLHAAGGELANYGVTPLPWPLNWPEPPPRPILAQNEPRKTPTTNEPAKRAHAPLESKRVAQPLIVIGTPREAAPVVETNSAPALVTNVIVNVAQSAPAAPTPMTNAPIETSSAKSKPPPAQAPGPVQVAPAPMVDSSPARPVQPEVVKVAAKVEPPASTNTATLAVAAKPATAEPARSSAVADTAPQNAPAPSLSSSPPPAATEQKSARESVAAEEPPGTSGEVQNSPSSPGSSRSFRVGATTLACASFGCLLFFLRRSRSPARGSIVTQSLERESGCVRPPAAKPKAPKAPAQ